MNIEFGCVLHDGDIKAFAKNHSHSVLKTVRLAWIFLAVVSFTLLLYYIREYYFDVIHVVLIVIILASLVYTFYDPVQKRLIRANAHLKGNRLKIAFYDEYYYEKFESPLVISEISVRYENIKSVYETGDHLFIYNGSGSCHIVPRAALAPDEYFVLRSFLSAIIGIRFKTV